MSVVPKPASAFSSMIFHVSPAVTGMDLFVFVDGPWFGECRVAGPARLVGRVDRRSGRRGRPSSRRSWRCRRRAGRGSPGSRSCPGHAVPSKRAWVIFTDGATAGNVSVSSTVGVNMPVALEADPPDDVRRGRGRLDRHVGFVAALDVLRAGAQAHVGRAHRADRLQLGGDRPRPVARERDEARDAGVRRHPRIELQLSDGELRDRHGCGRRRGVRRGRGRSRYRGGGRRGAARAGDPAAGRRAGGRRWAGQASR